MDWDILSRSDYREQQHRVPGPSSGRSGQGCPSALRRWVITPLVFPKCWSSCYISLYPGDCDTRWLLSRYRFSLTPCDDGCHSCDKSILCWKETNWFVGFFGSCFETKWKVFTLTNKECFILVWFGELQHLLWSIMYICLWSTIERQLDQCPCDCGNDRVRVVSANDLRWCDSKTWTAIERNGNLILACRLYDNRGNN